MSALRQESGRGLTDGHSLVAMAILAFAAVAEPSAGQSGRAQRGQAFVQLNCAGCHAVGRVGESPLAIAPSRTSPKRRRASFHA